MPLIRCIVWFGETFHPSLQSPLHL
jgi:hypothetical protein